jgi:hypothetical protein
MSISYPIAHRQASRVDQLRRCVDTHLGDAIPLVGGVAVPDQAQVSHGGRCPKQLAPGSLGCVLGEAFGHDVSGTGERIINVRDVVSHKGQRGLVSLHVVGLSLVLKVDRRVGQEPWGLPYIMPSEKVC